MRAILRRLPTVDDLHRHRAKIAGFVFGLLAPVMLAALFVVTYTGHGILVTPASPPPVYPNF